MRAFSLGGMQRPTDRTRGWGSPRSVLSREPPSTYRRFTTDNRPGPTSSPARRDRAAHGTARRNQADGHHPFPQDREPDDDARVGQARSAGRRVRRRHLRRDAGARHLHDRRPPRGGSTSSHSPSTSRSGCTRPGRSPAASSAARAARPRRRSLARLTDRPLRPSFKDGYRDEVQVVITVLSADMANPYDIPGMNAASLATSLAGLPFEGPVGSVRMGLIGGEWVGEPHLPGGRGGDVRHRRRRSPQRRGRHRHPHDRG